MAGTVTPLRPGALRTSETVRPPRSGARLKSVAPMLPPPVAALSVVERHAREDFPCARKGCAANGDVLSFVPLAGSSLVVLFCADCVEKLASVGVRPVPTAKGARK